MGEDLNDKIRQITDILGQEKVPDSVKELLYALTGTGGAANREPSSKTAEAAAFNEENAARSELEENLELARKIKKVVDRLNSNSDPKVNLLLAIKPFLNKKRQKRINDCVKLLTMVRLTSILGEYEKGGF